MKTSALISQQPYPTLAPGAIRKRQEAVERFRQRMLEWRNPVEYVNNMYGSHPGDDDDDYFEVVFGKD